MNNVGISVSNGTSYFDAADMQIVGENGVYLFEFSPHGGQKLFVVAQGKDSSAGRPEMTA